MADGDLNMLLGGISENIFENTVSVGQLKSVTGDGLAQELKNYMANCQGGLDGALDLAAAEEYLKKKRSGLGAAKREKQERQKAEKQALLSKLSYVRRECENLEENLRTAEENLKRQMQQGKDAPERRRGSGGRKFCLPTGRGFLCPAVPEIRTGRGGHSHFAECRLL